MTYLVDTSVWMNLSRSKSVATAFQLLASGVTVQELLICPPLVAEVGFAAQSPADHDKVMDYLLQFRDCPKAPSSRTTLGIQSALWHGGKLRAAGAMDTVVAAYGLENDATVLHYDTDYEHIASVLPDFKHEWIVPRGTA
ncbi:PIN domain-containing protein [Curtobacterium sp. MCSS17_016]|uniref:PIN domain-containing protein n=1 Tax=Curtobacterium sp. MCSS17_016 TaxID=2175644 RepID=UPI0011B663BB|nr:PIN domain-containing protein [Curtobacterium sp. MCSS17_016]